MRTHIDLLQMLRVVAARTASYPFKCWGFGEAVAMLGLLAAARVTGEPAHRASVEACFRRWWTGSPLSFADHVAPGVPLLMLACDDDRWSTAALALGELFRRCPRHGGVTVHRPDVEKWNTHVWVDCLYTDGAFLALLSRHTGEGAWQDFAGRHALEYVDALWDARSGLFFHGYDAGTGRANGVRWGRGNGWALLGLVDLLRFVRADLSDGSSLRDVVRRQVAALAELQDPSGHWHTVLDHPETYLETSVAAMMAWVIPQAVRMGLVAETFLATAEAAFHAALAATTSEGSLEGVSEATPVGDVPDYATRPTDVYPWGQGPWLLALADRIAPDAVWQGLP